MFTILVGTLVAIGGLVCGFDIGIISGNLNIISNQFSLSAWQQGSLVSILFAGAIVGSPLGGLLSDRIGRWRAIHVQNVFFVCGSLALCFATSFGHLLVGRFFMGIGTTMSSTCEVPLLCEFTEPKSRGRLGSAYEVCVTIGVLLSYIVNFVSYGRGDAWRTGFGIPGIFALFQSVALFWVPESPRWLMKQGRIDEALAVFKRIHGPLFRLDQLQPNVESLHDAAGQSSGEEEIKSDPWALMWEYRRSFAIAVLLNVLSQFTGGTTVRVYAPIIFQESGTSERTALIYNIILGIIKLSVVLVSASFVDSFGRKNLLNTGNFIIALGLLILCISFSKNENSDIHDPMAFLVGCAFCMGGYSVSWGPVLYLISAELFPVMVRGRALSANLIALNLAQLFVTLTFLPAIRGLGPASVFGCYLLLCAFSFLVISFLLVESAGKESRAILADLRLRHAKVAQALLPRMRQDRDELLRTESSHHIQHEHNEVDQIPSPSQVRRL